MVGGGEKSEVVGKRAREEEEEHSQFSGSIAGGKARMSAFIRDRSKSTLHRV